MPLVDEQKQEPTFPHRQCVACGTRGGGDPTKGLSNVVIAHGQEVCGHCWGDFAEADNATAGDRLVAWAAKKRGKAA